MVGQSPYPYFAITKTVIPIKKKSKRCTIPQLYFGKQLYIFRTDLLSIIRSLNTVFTAIGICHNKILKIGKITSVCVCIYMCVCVCVCVHCR
jgi:hypothetical protein